MGETNQVLPILSLFLRKIFVSHQPERTEKNCLNCGSLVQGRFCQVCGQENVVPHLTVWGFITHFIYDIIHFDGKFFGTLRNLIFKPGFVPAEYIQGRRQLYLEPMKMYLFTSAFFFLVFFSITHPGKGIQLSEGKILSKQERFDLASNTNHQMMAQATDSSLHRRLNYLLDTSYRIQLRDTTKMMFNDSSFFIYEDHHPYGLTARRITGHEVDISSKSPWLQNRIQSRWEATKKKYGDDLSASFTAITTTFLHYLPYLLFVSLPFFALILKLLYIRKKPIFYSDHAIFTLYHYIFTFIILLIFFLLNAAHDRLHWGFLQFLSVLFFMMPGVYLYFSMKHFYLQGKGKTFVKFLLLNIVALLIVSFLLLFFILLSFFKD